MAAISKSSGMPGMPRRLTAATAALHGAETLSRSLPTDAIKPIPVMTIGSRSFGEVAESPRHFVAHRGLRIHGVAATIPFQRRRTGSFIAKIGRYQLDLSRRGRDGAPVRSIRLDFEKFASFALELSPPARVPPLLAWLPWTRLSVGSRQPRSHKREGDRIGSSMAGSRFANLAGWLAIFFRACVVRDQRPATREKAKSARPSSRLRRVRRMSASRVKKRRKAVANQVQVVRLLNLWE